MCDLPTPFYFVRLRPSYVVSFDGVIIEQFIEQLSSNHRVICSCNRSSTITLSALILLMGKVYGQVKHTPEID